MASPRERAHINASSNGLDAFGEVGGDAFRQAVESVIAPSATARVDVEAQEEANQVDIPEAIKTFNETEYEITEIIAASQEPSPTATKAPEMSEVESKTRAQDQPSPGPDLEAAPAAAKFDLKDFLEASLRKRREAGIPKAQMGVTFKNLTVVGEGAGSLTIGHIFSPVFNAFKRLDPRTWYRSSMHFSIVHLLMSLFIGVSNQTTLTLISCTILLVLLKRAPCCSSLVDQGLVARLYSKYWPTIAKAMLVCMVL